jgi:hypothetical protein
MAPLVTRELDAFRAMIGGGLTQFAKMDPRVRERLANVRSRVVAVDYREDKRGEVGFYDYDNDVLVVAVVDPFAAELVDLVERKESPAITLEELAEALQLLARRNPKLQAALTQPRARAAAFVYAFAEGSGRESHRGCVVNVESEGRVTHGVVDLSVRELVAEPVR